MADDKEACADASYLGSRPPTNLQVGPFPIWVAKPIASIEAPDLLAVLKKIEAKGVIGHRPPLLGKSADVCFVLPRLRPVAPSMISLRISLAVG